MKARAVTLGVLCLSLLPGSALAEDDAAGDRHVPSRGSDGVYGRFDGTLDLALFAGAELDGEAPRGALRFSAHYLWTAGVYGRYADALGAREPRLERAASFGIDLRPLFLPRFALDAQQGPAMLDLTLDSLALTAGAYFGEPRRDDFGAERGFETGLGLGFPVFARAQGLWLETRAERRFPDRGSAHWLVSIGLAWHASTWATEEPR